MELQTQTTQQKTLALTPDEVADALVAKLRAGEFNGPDGPVTMHDPIGSAVVPTILDNGGVELEWTDRYDAISQQS